MRNQRGIVLGVDRLDTVGVAGSIPVEPTIKSTKTSKISLGYQQPRETSNSPCFCQTNTKIANSTHLLCGEIAVFS